MNRCDQYITGMPEYVLRAVAVVCIKIDERDSRHTVPGTCPARSDGEIVKEAEADGMFAFSMVPRRSDRAERVSRFAPTNGINGGAGCSGGVPRRIKRSWPDDGVRIEVP